MRARLYLSIAILAFVAACSNGGPGANPYTYYPPTATPSPTPTPAGPTPTPGPSVSPLAVASPAIQRAIASQAFAGVYLGVRSYLYNSSASFAPVSVLRRTMQASHTRSMLSRSMPTFVNGRVHPDVSGFGSCNDGVETDTITNGSAVEKLYEVFYDVNCTVLDQYYAYAISSNPPMTDLIGNVESFSLSGAVDGYETLTLVGDSTAPGSMVLFSQNSVNQSTSATVSLGLACSGSGTLTCGAGFTDSLSSGSDIGAIATIPVTISGSHVTISGATSTPYIGALGTLSLTAPTTPATAWTMNGGTAGTNGTVVNVSLPLNANGVVQQSGTINAVDAGDSGVLTMSSNATGFTGSVVQNNSPSILASFSLDLNGTGSITYLNGVTCPVTLWSPGC